MKLDLRFIIPGRQLSDRAILVAADGGLPRADVEGDENEAAIIAVDSLLRETWDFRAAVLETHPKWKDVPDGDSIPTLVWTEPAPADWTPPPSAAFGPIPVDPGDLPVTIRAGAVELLDELRGGAPPPELRPRWARPGWFDRASAWMRAASAAAGRPLTGQPRPFFLRGISALLRAPTDGPDLFLKAVFPPFHAEPVLSRLLAERFPATVPAVVAIEPDEGWLVVEDIGSAWVGEVPEMDRPDALRRGARALVAMQREFAPDAAAIRTLLDAGAPHRPLVALGDSMAAAIGPDGMGVADGGIEPDRARRVLEALAGSIAAAEAIGLPETVVHGDFHSGNAAFVDGRIVIIDWSDAAIASPAIDLATWVAWSGDRQAEIDAATDGWVDAWSAMVDGDALRAVIDDVLIVGAAYQVVSYDGIRRNLEPATRYTMTGGGDHFLKELEKIRDRRARAIQTS
ncbi:MAG: aminoglycoside phosphotransferase family protein [Chloroflexi bacterium]|nr:aminoglycoside phosphotransferase family protein [Chloroflexota bacterium]